MEQTKIIKVTHTIRDSEYQILKAMISTPEGSYNVSALAGMGGNNQNEYWTMVDLNNLYYKGLVDRTHPLNCDSIYSLKYGVEIEL